MSIAKKSQNHDFLSFVDFYDSIPDYDEINHLSKDQFYTKLKELRNKQITFNLTNISGNNKKYDNTYDNQDLSVFKDVSLAQIKSLQVNGAESNNNSCNSSPQLINSCIKIEEISNHKLKDDKVQCKSNDGSEINPTEFTTHSIRKNNLHQTNSVGYPQSLYHATSHPCHSNQCRKNFAYNSFNQKMWEYEYFRKLNNKLRAEELLKQSSLPPSMKKREKLKCDKSCFKKKKTIAKCRKKKCMQQNNNADFITTCPVPFDLKTAKRSNSSKIPASHSVKSMLGSTTSNTPTTTYPAARPNLAANLRAEWTRKKLLYQSNDKYKSSPDLFPLQNWNVRNSPAWKSLYFDATNEEDISLRLATRRIEQKLRQEEYQMNMNLMRQRVKSAPLLLEGTLQLSPSTNRHKCVWLKNPQNIKSTRNNQTNGIIQKKRQKKCCHRHCNMLRSNSDNASFQNNKETCCDPKPQSPVNDDDLESIEKVFL